VRKFLATVVGMLTTRAYKQAGGVLVAQGVGPTARASLALVGGELGACFPAIGADMTRDAYIIFFVWPVPCRPRLPRTGASFQGSVASAKRLMQTLHDELQEFGAAEPYARGPQGGPG